jgi:hypothetical protein
MAAPVPEMYAYFMHFEQKDIRDVSNHFLQRLTTVIPVYMNKIIYADFQGTKNIEVN